MAGEIDVLIRAQDEATKVIEETDAALAEFGMTGEELQKKIEQLVGSGKSLGEALDELRAKAEGGGEGLSEAGKGAEEAGRGLSEADKQAKKFATSIKQFVGGLVGFSTFLLLGRKVANAFQDMWEEGIKLNQMYRAGEPDVKAYNRALEEQARITQIIAVTTTKGIIPTVTSFKKGSIEARAELLAIKLAVNASDETMKELGLELDTLHQEFIDTTTGGVIPFSEALERLAKAEGLVVDELGPMTSSTAAWARQMERADMALLKQAGLLKDEIPDAIEETVDAAEDLSDVFARADLGIAGSIANILDTIDFLAGGGGELQIMADMLKNAIIDGGTISEEDAKAMFEQIFIEAQVLQIQLGNITAWEAAVNIRDQLGGSLDEARKIVNDILGGLDLISLLDIQLKIAGLDELAAATDPLQEKLFIKAVLELEEPTDPLLSMFQNLPEEMKRIMDETVPQLDRVEEGLRDWRDRVNEVAEGIGVIFQRADITISFTTSGGDTMP